jgi:hypothetical protein
LRQHSAPADLVWTYDRDVLINTLSKRRMPFRFTCFYFIMAARPPLAEAERWLAEADLALRDRPPRYIVLRRLPGSSLDGPVAYRTLPLHDNGPPARLVRDVLARRYHLARSIHNYDLYELKGSS